MKRIAKWLRYLIRLTLSNIGVREDCQLTRYSLRQEIAKGTCVVGDYTYGHPRVWFPKPPFRLIIGPYCSIAIVFLRILRGGPTVTLLVSSATTRLTLANVMSVFGIAAAAALAQVHPVLTSVLAGVLFGDVLTMVLLQRAAMARMPGGIGSLWRSLAVASASVVILTMTLRLLPEPSFANRGIVAMSGALPAAILGWGALSRWRLRERT